MSAVARVLLGPGPPSFEAGPAALQPAAKRGIMEPAGLGRLSAECRANAVPIGSAVDQSDHNARFAEVFVPHLTDAFRLARWLTGSRADAEDVVQESAIRALKGIGRFGGLNARVKPSRDIERYCASPPKVLPQLTKRRLRNGR